jgi:hypothetical protein
MRIAISGAVCTGKTTLGKALAEKLGVSFIEENLETVFGSTNRTGNSLGNIAKELVTCLTLKKNMEETARTFVVDRCPLDIMNLWQAAQLPRCCEGHDILDICERYLGNYNFVVLTHFEGIPFMKESGDDGLTRSNAWFQFNGSIRTVGLAHHFLPPAKIIQIPRDIVSQEARLSFVLKSIEDQRKTSG